MGGQVERPHEAARQVPRELEASAAPRLLLGLEMSLEGFPQEGGLRPAAPLHRRPQAGGQSVGKFQGDGGHGNPLVAVQ